CPHGLHLMEKRGSSHVTVLPDSEASAVGDGNHGLAVWSEHLYEEGKGRFSRIRSWASNGEIQTIEELPGDVCGLAAGQEHIAGFRGEMAEGSGLCRSGVTNPRFFWISKHDGEVRE